MHGPKARVALLLITTITASACVTSRPCAEGGDISWGSNIRGNKQCLQRKLKDGTYVNDGRFVHWHENGQIGLEGQFKDGKKTGQWVEFDATGKKIAEKYYEEGVEINPNAPAVNRTNTR